MMQFNIRNSGMKKCAFCKFWYDPTNSAIRPKNPVTGIWEYDGNIQKKCLINNGMRKATMWCSKYECKL